MALSHSKPRRKVGTIRRLADGRLKVTVSSGITRDGRHRRISGFAESEDEAEALAIELSAKLGKRPDLGRGLTLKRWWAAYKVTKGKRITQATLNRYKGDMERVWLPSLGAKDISLIEAQDVQAVLLTLGTRSSATHAKSALSAVLTQAVREGHLGMNPLRGVTFELPGDVGAQDDLGTDWGDDPFATIEGTSSVWSVETVLEVQPLLEGVPLETAWLCMVGAGLRLEEALALQWKDVRRVKVDGWPVTQIAVYKAKTEEDGLKRTKTRRSVRIVALLEPFGERLWQLRGEASEAVCDVSAANIRHRWSTLFEAVTSKHAKEKGRHKGKLHGYRYVPLSKMRNTHATIMQQAGVLDSINAAMHGHSQLVSYAHYQRADGDRATVDANRFVLLSGSAANSEDEQEKMAANG